MSTETCPQHAQFDKEIKELLESVSGLEANMLHVLRALDRIEKSNERRITALEKSLSDQRVADAKQDGKINVLWSFLIDKNGLIILGILAYVIMGRVG